MFDQELNFFIENQEELVKQYRGKVLVLIGKNVVGAFGDLKEAYKEAVKNYELGTFMLQRCEPGPDAYTVTISSRGIAQF
jgi:hypothetical protein